MSVTSLTGKDTIKINGNILADFPDGEVVVLNHPNDTVAVKTGKDGNAIYAYNNSGRQVEVTMRILLAGADDRFLNNLKSLFDNDPAAFTLLTGEFIKNVGDGKGNLKQIIYILSGGAFKRGVDAKENTEGDTEQAVATYHFVFSNAPRSIG